MLRTRVLSWPSGYVCWQCRQRLVSQRRTIALATAAAARYARSNGEGAIQPSHRAFHATPLASQTSISSHSPAPPNPFLVASSPPPIRTRLQRWQEENGGPNDAELGAFENMPIGGEVSNSLTKLHFGGSKSDEETIHNERWYEDNDEEGDLITIGLFLKPGDVVELQQSGREPVVAVFVQQLGLVSQFFSVNGRWCHGSLATISFAISSCMDPAMIEPIIPYLPTQQPDLKDATVNVQVPRELAAPVTSFLQGLRDESEKIYRENAAVLDNAYSTLADETRTRMMTLTQIAKALLGRTHPTWTPTNAMLLAVRKALLHNAFRFSSDRRNQRLTNVFSIRPKDEVQGIEHVHDWIRQYQAHQAACIKTVDHDTNASTRKQGDGARFISEFIDKARRLIVLSREHRSPLYGALGPTKIRHPISEQSSAIRLAWGESFNSTDKEIINFVSGAVLGQKFANMPSLHSAISALLHATGLYKDHTKELFKVMQTSSNQVAYMAGQVFLQEIGVLTPYENRVLYDPQLMLPTVRLSRNVELLNAKAELTRRSPDFRDSMADLRHDWGTTNVYCIDQIGAQEIDDGVSIERVDGKDSEFWAHVHVANPTAFFDKTHVLSGLAAHMTESVYTPERNFPMLPAWASQKYFSLRANRPVLTFSTRIDLNGTILERKVQPGIIRRVTSLTPTELCDHLGMKEEGEINSFVVGGEVPRVENARTPIKLSPKQVQELRDMYTVSSVLWNMRKARGGIKGNLGNFDCTVHDRHGTSGLSQIPPSHDKARMISGDPIIELKFSCGIHLGRQDHSASNLVEEFMLLACSSAAAWCAERAIPVMFRGTVESPMAEGAKMGLSIKEFRSKIVDPFVQKHGRLSHTLAFHYMDVMGRSIAHSSPLSHSTIGVESYTKVTSPLRRFSDMIAHWQIEAALRQEARTGATFNANDPATASRPVLPFSQRQIQESIITLSPREKIIAYTKSASKQFWAAQAFARSFYSNEAPLPETFRVWIRHLTTVDLATGLLPDYGIRVNVMKNAEFDFQIGDEYEAEIESVDLWKRTLILRPIRLLGRESWMEEFKDVIPQR